MKIVYLIIAFVCIIAITILYFQLIISVSVQVPFFDRFIDAKLFTFYLILLSLVAGICATLAITSFLNSSSRIDDDFDL